MAVALETSVLWRVVAVALILGAGLPVLFAIGVRAGAPASTASGDGDEPGEDDLLVSAPPGRRVLAALCFVVVLAVVALGITYVVATGSGMTLSFEHVYPTLVPKP